MKTLKRLNDSDMNCQNAPWRELVQLITPPPMYPHTQPPFELQQAPASKCGFRGFFNLYIVLELFLGFHRSHQGGMELVPPLHHHAWQSPGAPVSL